MKQFHTTVSDLVSYSGSHGAKNLRLFIKAIERNMNNSINIDNTLDKERKSKGYALKIMNQIQKTNISFVILLTYSILKQKNFTETHIVHQSFQLK